MSQASPRARSSSVRSHDSRRNEVSEHDDSTTRRHSSSAGGRRYDHDDDYDRRRRRDDDYYRDDDRDRSSRRRRHYDDDDEDEQDVDGGGRDRKRDRDYRRDYDYDERRKRHDSRDYDDQRDPKRSRHSRSPSHDSRKSHHSRSHREDSRPYERDDRRRRSPPRRERSRRSESPALTEEQREMRSVFVSQLAARVGDRELRIFFETNAGPVREARVIVDRVSRRSKGVGYVEFKNLDTVSKALGLTNTRLLGIPIIVQLTEAEKNRQAAQAGQPGKTKGMYATSLSWALTEDDIKAVFLPFGAIDYVELRRDDRGRSAGYAYIQFTDPQNAFQAVQKMNNFNLAGREIKCGLVADKGAPAARDASTLDEGSSANLSSNKRIELMEKLAARADPTAELMPHSSNKPEIPEDVTRNVVMRNAFDPAEETEPNWDTDLRDDVRGECDFKYGKVVDIFVVKESAGEIYIRFDGKEAAAKAQDGLNGRWFGGRQISAAFVPDSIYDAKK